MMTELHTVRVGDLGRVVTGKTPPSSQPELFGELYPFLTPTDINGVARYVETTRFLSIEGCDYQHRLMLPARAVCVVCIGATIGKVCMTNRPSFTNQQVNSVIVNENEHDPFFVYHLLATLRDELKANAGGAATPIINKTAFSEIEVNLPSLSVQQRIAGILSAYDELIENNQRRIQILETMARAVYREWFVEFRFPGHDTIPRVASPLGDIPKSWEIVAFTEIADVLSGGTPKTTTAEYWNGEIPFFTPRDAPTCFYVQDTDKHITRLGLSNCASELYAPDTVFITARGTVGRVALPSVSMAMNQSCYALRGKAGMPQRFLFLMTLQQVDYLQTNTGGATFDTIVVDTFRQMKVVKPAHEVIASFARQIDAIFEHVDTIQRQVQNLRRTRDLLLPRLLSGQVALADTAG